MYHSSELSHAYPFECVIVVLGNSDIACKYMDFGAGAGAYDSACLYVCMYVC